jgi:hypothetical protein
MKKMTEKSKNRKIVQQRVWPYPNHIELGTTELKIQRRLLKKDIKGAGKIDLDFSILNEFNQFVFFENDPCPDGDFSYDIEIESRYDPDNTKNNESYELAVDAHGVKIVSKTYLGALHALATLSSLIRKKGECYIVENTPLMIRDDPKVSYRSLQIDASSSNFSLDFLENQIRGLSFIKMNCLHITFNSEMTWLLAFGDITKLLSDETSHFHYNRSNMRHLVDYAANHGVKIVSEIEISKQLLEKIVKTEKPENSLGIFFKEIIDGFSTEKLLKPEFFLNFRNDLEPSQIKTILDTLLKYEETRFVTNINVIFQYNFDSEGKYIKTIPIENNIILYFEELEPKDYPKLKKLQKLGFKFIRTYESNQFEEVYLKNLSWIKAANEKLALGLVNDLTHGGIVGAEIIAKNAILDESNFDSKIWLNILSLSENLWRFQELIPADNLLNAKTRLAYVREDLLRLNIKASPVFKEHEFDLVEDKDLMRDINVIENVIPSHLINYQSEAKFNPYCIKESIITKNCDGTGGSYIE